MSGAAVHTCTCRHEYQDEKYGKGMRVCCVMANGQKRCTVCLAVHGSPKIGTK